MKKPSNKTHTVQKLRPIMPRKRKVKEELDELKQDVEMDEHKVSLPEIYARLGTDPNAV